MLDHVRKDLDEIADWLPSLLDDRVPGTPRRWAESTYAEPTEPDGAAAATAPARLDVLDTLRGLYVRIPDLVDAVKDKLDREGPDVTGRLPDEDRLRIYLKWLRAQLPAIGESPALAVHVEDEVRQLTAAVRRATGRTWPIQALPVGCPLCEGRSRLQVHHSSGRIKCGDCGAAWEAELPGVGGWSWLAELLKATEPLPREETA